MKFSYEARSQTIQKLQDETLDLLIVGGVIVGAGVALQAAAAGAKVGLIDMQDFAGGTSSRSTKLVHGGIRYLKTFDIGLVSDVVSERKIVQNIAPHILQHFSMLMPIYDSIHSTFDMRNIKVGMNLYDSLGGVTDEQYQNRVLSRQEVLQHDPNLKTKGLVGGGLYLDFGNNDSRLVIENIKEAVDLGALAVSNLKVLKVTHNGEVVDGVLARDVLTGEQVAIHAKLVLNATGPWSSKFLNRDANSGQGQVIRPTKGVHLVVDHDRLPVKQPIYSDSGEWDGRMLFVIPREGKTYFGTTDTDYQGNYQHPRVEQEDVDYLLKAVNNRFPGQNIRLEDVKASWVGLRPLLDSNRSSDYNGGASNIGKVTDESFNLLIETVEDYQHGYASRHDVEELLSNLKINNSEKYVSNSQIARGASLDIADDGLVSLSGGKLTDYRKMAAGALTLTTKILAEDFNVHLDSVDSTRLQVSGGHFDSHNVAAAIKKYQQLFIDKGLSADEADILAQTYGSNSPKVAAYIDQLSAAPGLTLAETISLHYAIDYEMVLTPVDYMLRRTNYVLFHPEQLAVKKQAFIAEMARVFQWSIIETQHHELVLNQLLYESRLDYLKNK
ncbi:type 1 glycerol-3-phosphate oxidase [Bombilactobacillus folatiphilus]|uniref:Alpha-glycerophosphate oxidase n=1 Tax=Bombilactobacillus folatiphilus TaxID=2923362 RepID=A0ABY4P9V5_9LACO|nr:type 1 glycerol-3-phosphate oxidase [Bombilactobacillus folatiphilus]UQS82533.1 type 1 glycerol-3-phosphate oxidase [Bombilactobacillus folatiphilus]